MPLLSMLPDADPLVAAHERRPPAATILNLIAPPLPPLKLRRLLAGSPGRDAAEAVVREVFEHSHGARIDQFYPQLLAFESSDGIGAVVGVRTGEDEPAFFSEQYLEQPIDTILRQAIGRRVSRAAVAEIGNLASRSPGDSRWLIAAVTAYLYGAGYRWVLFTATAPLYNAFRRIGLQPTRLAAADQSRLHDRDSQWGRYYRLDPHVCVGDIHAGFDALQQQVRHAPASMHRLWHAALKAGVASQGCCREAAQ
jgi:hypothetical protein